jgi:hypothetical protein
VLVVTWFSINDFHGQRNFNLEIDVRLRKIFREIPENKVVYRMYMTFTSSTAKLLEFGGEECVLHEDYMGSTPIAITEYFCILESVIHMFVVKDVMDDRITYAHV